MSRVPTRWIEIAAHCHAMAAECEAIQARNVNRKRGAWRRPQLRGDVSKLAKALKAEFDRAEHEIVMALVGDTETHEHQSESEDAVALAHHGLSEEDGNKPVDRTKLAGILLILALWRTRQLMAANAAIESSFAIGKGQALKKLGREGAPEQPATMALLPQLKVRFESDVQRLYGDLLDGSRRSSGVTEIVNESEDLGEAVTELRALFEGEVFRLDLFAEFLVWHSWMQGWRAGAIEASLQAQSEGTDLPIFYWAGPADGKTCAPCSARFGEGFTAVSLSDLPAPWEICNYGVNCRHWYVISP